MKYEQLDGLFVRLTQRKVGVTFGKCKLRYKGNIKMDLGLD